MLIELTENFNPPRIIHRDEQISKIKEVFHIFKERGYGSNLIILGPTGTGKSASINKIISSEDNSIFGSCLRNDTTFKLFKSMFDIKCNTLDRLKDECINILKEKPRIIIVDEVNKINDMANFFNTLNIIYRETNCPIIIITNNRLIFDQIPDDAKLTLFFNKIEFPAYDAMELYDIIKDRLNLLKGKIPEISEEFLRKVCAYGGRESSARMVLNLTLRCIYDDNFEITYLDKIYKDRQKDELRDYILNLNFSEKSFLRTLLCLYEQKSDILPSEIHKSINNFSLSRVSQLITKFDADDKDVEYGLIKCKYLNKGKAGGRLRVINFLSEEIYQILKNLL